MTDAELLSFLQAGFLPSSTETDEEFLERVRCTQQRLTGMGQEAIPLSHWDWAKEHVGAVFGFSPESLPAFYSDARLTPWQGAATWVEGGALLAIQLRSSLKKGSFLGFYDRGEILAHEAVHAFRAPLQSRLFEEFFAFLASEKRWRRIFGPIVARPWEVWPFLGFCLLSNLSHIGFAGAALWTFCGLGRLGRRHWQLKRCAKNLLPICRSAPCVRALLVALSDAEILLFASEGDIEAYIRSQTCLRWRALRYRLHEKFALC